jgi:hypothetical protein
LRATTEGQLDRDFSSTICILEFIVGQEWLTFSKLYEPGNESV